MHSGSFNILLVGNRNLGMEEMCQLYAKNYLRLSDVGSNKECDDVKGEIKFKASTILPSSSDKSGCLHYDINMSVVIVEWRRKNPRLNKDFITSTDALVLVYNETKKHSFISVIELVSEMKYCCQQNHLPPFNVACVKAQKREIKDLRKDKLYILLNEDVFDINLNCIDSINKMFHSLLCKYLQINTADPF